jgi:protein SCO1
MALRPQAIVIGVAVVLAATAVLAWLGPSARPAEMRAATLLSEPRPMAAFELTDQHGRSVTRELFEGRWSVLFAGFTHCPDACPATLGQLTALTARLGEPSLQTVLLSVDPERDTPAQLGRYLDAFPAPVVGLTGPLTDIEQLGASLGISFIKVPGAHGEYTVDHSIALVLIDPAARVAGYVIPPFEFDDFATDLRALLTAR